jgi:CBS domain-containing protein
MTTRVVSVHADDTVAAAVDRMMRYGFSALPVTSSNLRLVGIVSLLDVIRYREAHAEEGIEADQHAPVTDIMSHDVVSMSATANVAAVARRLAESGQLRVLPVVQGGKLVGIVTRTDLLRGAAAAPKQSGLSRLLGGRDRDADDDGALAALTRQRRAGPPPPAATPVSEIMTTQVVTVAPSDPVTLAVQRMLRGRHPSLPVVETDRTLLGIISEADILADPQAGRRAHATVGGVMTRGVISIGPTATVGQARTLVADRGVRTLPVVDGRTLVGVLSRSDLV